MPCSEQMPFSHHPSAGFARRVVGTGVGPVSPLARTARAGEAQVIPTGGSEAAISAEVRAAGASADAHRLTAPHPAGIGARLATERALANAGPGPAAVDRIDMLGTAIPAGDAEKSAAIPAVFVAHAAHPSATSTEETTGHRLAAAVGLRYAFILAEERWVRVARSSAFGLDGPDPRAATRVPVPAPAR